MTRRQTRTVIITAVVLGLLCLGMVFWAVTRSPDPVAEPVPFPTTSATSTSTTPSPTTPTTTSAAPTTTTTTTQTTTKAPVAPPKTTTKAPAAPPATTVNALCQAGQWQRDTAYDGGTLVQHNGFEWYARSWNYNAEPGANADNVWVRAINC
jgi:cell division septation protein DedD